MHVVFGPTYMVGIIATLENYISIKRTWATMHSRLALTRQLFFDSAGSWRYPRDPKQTAARATQSKLQRSTANP